MIYNYKSNDEPTVKKDIKEALRGGMILMPCISCGETWFVPANFKNIFETSFICNKCIIQKQWLRENQNE